MSESERQGPRLLRRISLPILVLYGLGTTIGAGIFVLLGAVGAKAGAGLPVSFLMAALLAGTTAVAFCELAGRFPRAAGEAVYVKHALGSARLALATGLVVAVIGITSGATILSGFAEHLEALVGTPTWISGPAALLVLLAVSGWGIGQSAGLAALLACIEIGAIAVVIAAGAPHFLDTEVYVGAVRPIGEMAGWAGIASGAVIAFFAFIGFEDMVNVAEEVHAPTRTMPAGILLTLFITLGLYMGLSIVAVGALGAEGLAGSATPMAEVFEAVTGLDGRAMTLVVLVAVTNGALVQIIMASRVFYGLAAQGWLPAGLARIHPKTHTPLAALALVGLAIAILGLLFPLERLARASAVMTLLVFALINFGLLRLGKPEPGSGLFVAPRWLVVLGFIGSLALVAFQLAEAFRQWA